MRVIRRAALALALAHAHALSFASQAALADTIEVDTYRGKAEAPLNPETVAVFDISALDTLNALGVPVAATPERVYVDYLEDVAKSTEKVGSLFEPDFEAVNALQPDLIVAGGRSSKQVDALSEFAPTIDMTIWGDDLLGQVTARLHAYGEIFGKEDEAKALETELLNAIDRVKESANGAGKALIVLTNGPKLSVYGEGSRFGWLHSILGIEPAIDNVKASTHGEAVSFEFIRDTDPDWLIVIDRAAAIGQDAALASKTLDNKLVGETKAWKSGQVIYLDAAKVYIAAGGHQSLMGTLEELETAFGKTR